MTDPYPITPSPELVQQWLGDFFGCTVTGEVSDSERYLATQAARWGADQELEACCEWVSQWRCMVGGNRPEVGLRADRRPKPPSLTEQGLAALDRLSSGSLSLCTDPVTDTRTIRAALDRLKELEQNND